MGLRTSPIRDLLAAAGATFGALGGAEVPVSFGSIEDEYNTIRQGVGVTDYSFTTRYRIPEDGLDFLEQYAAGPVSSIRFGRVLHTFAANKEGLLASDLFLANDDEHMLMIGENLAGDEAVNRTLDELGGFDEGLEDLTATTALFSIDGYKAWAVAKDLFGADVLGLPYLSIETYELNDVEIKLIRAGKTSEFGYLLMVPQADAEAVWKKIIETGEPHGIKPVGTDVHHLLRLDGRFFNIFKEGAAVREPLALGLQWMIDLDGDDFCGREALMARRESGLQKKIIGLLSTDAAVTLNIGDKILAGNDQVANIVSAGASPTLGRHIGLALFDVDYAYSGLVFKTQDGNPIETISMPPFIPKSLTVKLDEM